MVTSQFESLLKEFESFFDCPLHPDKNNSCYIKLPEGIHVQIELDKDGQVLIGCRLGIVHMGRYRENLMRQALKSNEATIPSTGVFGFSHKSNHLILFMKIKSLNLNTNLIKDSLPPFIEKGKIWKEAIEKGEIPVVQPAMHKKGSAGLFGLIS